ncbi:MAG TPA: formyltransferase family protein [Myxococcota bacterium]
MKWILCGKNDAAIAALEFLVQQGDEVLVVGVHGDDGRDGWQRSLRKAAARLGVRFEQPRKIHAPEVLERLAGFGARALFSIQYDQILHAPLFRALPAPCLNLHFSLLPRHRGVSPIAWAILSGDAEAGATLHHMVEAIDAGDLIAQQRVRIGAEDTARDLYDETVRAAVRLFCASYPFSDSLLATRLPQDAGAAVYHRAGDFDFSQRRVDWSRPAAELQRWLRAMIFPPHQHPEIRVGGRSLEVTRVGAELAPAAAPPGSVLEVSPQGARIACADASLWIRGLADPARPEPSREAPLASLRVGDRLG